MDLFASSDDDLKDYASNILDDLNKWGNQKNWEKWSSYFHARAQSEENKLDVERQWKESPALSAFKPEKECVGVLRRENNVLTIWKMFNETTDDEILGILGFEMENDEIKVCRYFVS